MDLQLKDKVIIVTGGAKGIGSAIVRACAAEGAAPVIVNRPGDAGKKLHGDLSSGGAKTHLIETELMEPKNCEHVV